MMRVVYTFLIVGLGALIAGCTQVIKVPIERNNKTISETKATSVNPPQFYVCGDGMYPCAPKVGDLSVSVEKPMVKSTELIQIKPKLNHRRSTKHEKHVQKTKCHC